MRLPELLAKAHGKPCQGCARCCFCGANADQIFELPKSFTAKDLLANPTSRFLCNGCHLCLEERGEAVYPNGTKVTFTKAYRRMLSHVITESSVIQATKAHISFLRERCTNPPDPPFAISIAVSGQKHTLFRGVVCHSREIVTVGFEGELVTYRPSQLVARLSLTGKLVAATGKPALSETPSSSFWFRVCERYENGAGLCEEWIGEKDSPLSRLAAFLTPRKEDSEREYPSDQYRGVSA